MGSRGKLAIGEEQPGLEAGGKKSDGGGVSGGAVEGVLGPELMEQGEAVNAEVQKESKLDLDYGGVAAGQRPNAGCGGSVSNGRRGGLPCSGGGGTVVSNSGGGGAGCRRGGLPCSGGGGVAVSAGVEGLVLTSTAPPVRSVLTGAADGGGHLFR
nr:loricrin-like [Aegilops tauschii subsp. strangulata]